MSHPKKAARDAALAPTAQITKAARKVTPPAAVKARAERNSGSGPLPPAPPARRILAVDIGGTHVKFRVNTGDEVRKFASGPELTPSQMCTQLQGMTADWAYDVVSLGYPGPVLHGRPLLEPHNLAPGWVGFDFAGALGRPIKLVNDAAMQALGSYEGGRMLFLGLGTGLGTTLVLEGNILVPLEAAHLPYRRKTFEDYVGQRGLDRLGRKRWRRVVNDVVTRLRLAFVADCVVLGGGNSRLVKRLPENTRLGKNANAFVGGFRLWEDAKS